MWWSDRRGFILGLLAVSGCGFTPVYGPGNARGLRGAVLVQAPKTREEFELVKALERQLGLPETRTHTLSYALTITEQTVVVSSAQELTRFNVIGHVDYVLTDLDGVVVDKGKTQAFTSYSATGSTLATDQSQRDARDRLTVILADQVVSQIAARFTP